MSSTTETYQAPDSLLPGMRQFGMVAAGLGLLLTGAGFAMSGLDRFFQAYLVAYTFWMGIVLGSLALLMVQHLTGGAWGVVLRRPFEAAVQHAALHGGAVPAHRVRHALALRVDARPTR